MRGRYKHEGEEKWFHGSVVGITCKRGSSMLLLVRYDGEDEAVDEAWPSDDLEVLAAEEDVVAMAVEPVPAVEPAPAVAEPAAVEERRPPRAARRAGGGSRPAGPCPSSSRRAAEPPAEPRRRPHQKGRRSRRWPRRRRERPRRGGGAAGPTTHRTMSGRAGRPPRGCVPGLFSLFARTDAPRTDAGTLVAYSPICVLALSRSELSAAQARPRSTKPATKKKAAPRLRALRLGITRARM